jgi:hypothetical protein
LRTLATVKASLYNDVVEGGSINLLFALPAGGHTSEARYIRHFVLHRPIGHINSLRWLLQFRKLARFARRSKAESSKLARRDCRVVAELPSSKATNALDWIRAKIEFIGADSHFSRVHMRDCYPGALRYKERERFSEFFGK